MMLLPTWVVLVGCAVLILVILAAVLVLARERAPQDAPGPKRAWWKRLFT